MKQPKEILISDLLLDQKNARFESEQPSQPAALLALAADPEVNLLELATDIVEQRSTDPTMLAAVVPSAEDNSRYIVLEGNRRVAALKGLENPSLVTPAFSAKDGKKFNKLSEIFLEKPIDRILCRPFDKEEEARHWITLRHTGKNKGRGLQEWTTAGKDRYLSRHGGEQSPQGQVLDFVLANGSPSDEARGSKMKILTNLKRLIGTPEVRDRLGIDLTEGRVVAHFPPNEVARSLTRVAEDLLTKEIKVKDIYHRNDRIAYANSIPSSDLPSRGSRLENPIDLATAKVTEVDTNKRRRKAKRKTPRHRTRRSLIPGDLPLEIVEPRINDIRIELSELGVEKAPNACSVLLRVFVELSVDHFLEQEQLMSEEDRRETNLSKKMKDVAEHLVAQGRIDRNLKRAIDNMADKKRGVLLASVFTMNQYVHNKYVRPKPTDLLLSWDELQPFILQIWPEIG